MHSIQKRTHHEPQLIMTVKGRLRGCWARSFWWGFVCLAQYSLHADMCVFLQFFNLQIGKGRWVVGNGLVRVWRQGVSGYRSNQFVELRKDFTTRPTDIVCGRNLATFLAELSAFFTMVKTMRSCIDKLIHNILETNWCSSSQWLGPCRYALASSGTTLIVPQDSARSSSSRAT